MNVPSPVVLSTLNVIAVIVMRFSFLSEKGPRQTTRRITLAQLSSGGRGRPPAASDRIRSMKFLCLDCDAPMKLHSSEGPDEGSLTVTFRCPECGFRVAMLTNPFETQMVRSLGVKIGDRGPEPTPFEHVRTMMSNPRTDAFEGEAGSGAVTEAPACPFAAMVNEGAVPVPSAVVWTSEAEARVERIPSFIRPMARRAIERFAAERGYATIDETVMDEARGAFGM
jgi:DNA-directed RNA polymerase subunit RPC12/RpoP